MYVLKSVLSRFEFGVMLFVLFFVIMLKFFGLLSCYVSLFQVVWIFWLFLVFSMFCGLCDVLISIVWWIVFGMFSFCLLSNWFNFDKF